MENLFETSVGDITFNFMLHTLRCGDKSVALTPSESKLLSCLILNGKTPLTAAELLKNALEKNQPCTTTIVETNLCRLRKKMHDIGAETTIKAIRFSGYVVGNGDHSAAS